MNEKKKRKAWLPHPSRVFCGRVGSDADEGFLTIFSDSKTGFVRARRPSMTYFDCFVVGSWMLVIGWYLGAIYVQNQNEKPEAPRVVEEPEPSPDREAIEICAVACAD
jgi:hypothetical protein